MAVSYTHLDKGIQGPSFTVSTACSSGGDAITMAAMLLLTGEADAVAVSYTHLEMAEGPFEEMEPEVEQTDRFPQRFFDLVQESGIYRCALPEEYGGYGMNDLDVYKRQGIHI